MVHEPANQSQSCRNPSAKTTACARFRSPSPQLLRACMAMAEAAHALGALPHAHLVGVEDACAIISRRHGALHPCRCPQARCFCPVSSPSWRAVAAVARVAFVGRCSCACAGYLQLQELRLITSESHPGWGCIHPVLVIRDLQDAGRRLAVHDAQCNPIAKHSPQAKFSHLLSLAQLRWGMRQEGNGIPSSPLRTKRTPVKRNK